jgi:predicted RNA binding protein YcfA (HicA-like mRNA interferase family)
MGRLPVLSGADAVRIFGKAGWTVDRQRGSHVILVKDGHIATPSVPDHKELARGTLRSLIRAAGMTTEDFEALAKKRSPRPYCHPGSAKTLVWDRQSPTSSGLLSGRVLPMVAAGNQPSHSVRPCTSAVHLPVRPWSPRSQGFPRGGDAGHTEAPRRSAVASRGKEEGRRAP